MATKTQQHAQTKWIARNPLTRKYETIDIETAELLPGQTALKVYWMNATRTWATIPGDCIYRMSADYQLVCED